MEQIVHPKQPIWSIDRMIDAKGLSPYPFDIQNDQLYDLEQLAKLFKVSKSKLEKMKDDELPMSIAPMGKRVFPRTAINKWLAERNPVLWEMVAVNQNALTAVQGAK